MTLDMLEKFEYPTIVAAHPDDETISSSQVISLLRKKISIIFVTGNHERQEEAINALSNISELTHERIHFLGIDEAKIPTAAPQAYKTLERTLKSIGADMVITHAFEGGHFDHDLVRFFMDKLYAESHGKFTLAQFALYFYKNGSYYHNVFLDPDGSDICLTPNAESTERKRKMLAAYASQQNYLRFFDPGNIERLRIYQKYEADPRRFLARPHKWGIGYDQGINREKNWELFVKTVTKNL